MSETQAQYRVSGLSEGPKPASLLPFSDPDFKPPTHIDIRAVTQRFGLTGTDLARLTGVLPRTVRKWLAPPDIANHSPMPYAAWRLLLIESSLARPGPMPAVENE